MKTSTFLTLLCLISSGVVKGQDTLSFTGFKRVLFLGNSITYEGTYVADIECYLKLKYPGHKLEIINAGLPSETVSGLSETGHADNRFPRPDLRERLQRVLSLTKPDLVLASYGINDGIYMPFDEQRFNAYKVGIHWLHGEILKTGATPVHLTGAFYDEKRGKNAGYEHTMDEYARWLVSMNDSAGWNVIDIYHPMKEYLYAHRKIDEAFHLDGFALAQDGVHPDANAHWLMARTILLSMGESAVAEATSVENFAMGFKSGVKVLELIKQKQLLMKDAWITAAGHKRPEMKKGLPLRPAKQREAALNLQIEELLNE